MATSQMLSDNEFLEQQLEQQLQQVLQAGDEELFLDLFGAEAGEAAEAGDVLQAGDEELFLDLFGAEAGEAGDVLQAGDEELFFDLFGAEAGEAGDVLQASDEELGFHLFGHDCLEALDDNALIATTSPTVASTLGAFDGFYNPASDLFSGLTIPSPIPLPTPTPMPMPSHSGAQIDFPLCGGVPGGVPGGYKKRKRNVHNDCNGVNGCHNDCNGLNGVNGCRNDCNGVNGVNGCRNDCNDCNGVVCVVPVKKSRKFSVRAKNSRGTGDRFWTFTRHGLKCDRVEIGDATWLLSGEDVHDFCGDGKDWNGVRLRSYGKGRKSRDFVFVVEKCLGLKHSINFSLGEVSWVKSKSMWASGIRAETYRDIKLCITGNKKPGITGTLSETIPPLRLLVLPALRFLVAFTLMTLRKTLVCHPDPRMRAELCEDYLCSPLSTLSHEDLIPQLREIVTMNVVKALQDPTMVPYIRNKTEYRHDKFETDDMLRQHLVKNGVNTYINYVLERADQYAAKLLQYMTPIVFDKVADTQDVAPPLTINNSQTLDEHMIQIIHMLPQPPQPPQPPQAPQAVSSVSIIPDMV